eukprot:CAMPEP_0170432638 /NCGR_PEP_ID=MMETSP0117_2-20130122/42059_1 /TAXON_ID=400756 /ORGANISM="Durinskia baltica, Strain CSIRO CS-38" /LENGTH=48 /DNA_ID= /DNA_START= /DNA_END= /DNA_ORIENTATION=
MMDWRHMTDWDTMGEKLGKCTTEGGIVQFSSKCGIARSEPTRETSDRA